MTRKAQAAIEAWNAANPAGTPVIYYGHPTAKPRLTRTTSAAYPSGCGTPMVRLEGMAGGFCLTHLHVADGQGRPIVSRALSVQQPWATAQTLGPKPGENRVRRIFSPPHGGAFVAMHASERLDRDGWDIIGGLWKCNGVGFAHGAVVGVVRYLPPLSPGEREFPISDWRVPSHHWYPRVEALHFADAVPCKGRLGLWRMPADVAAAVQSRIPAGWPVSVAP